MDPGEIRSEHLRGEVLYGNDLTGDALRQWYADEERGYADLAGFYSPGEADWSLKTRAMNRFHASFIPRREFDCALVIGCAKGEDVLALGKHIRRIVAIEPNREWWVERLDGIPAEFRAPTLDGSIDLPGGSADLAVALGALHHIATVGNVIGEMARVLAPGGYMILREPMISMGDFRTERPGLTRRERGIPQRLMEGFIRDAGMRKLCVRPCSFQALNRLAGKFGVATYNHPALVRLDDLLSRAFALNARYWRPRLIDKVAPTSCVYIARKPG